MTAPRTPKRIRTKDKLLPLRYRQLTRARKGVRVVHDTLGAGTVILSSADGTLIVRFDHGQSVRELALSLAWKKLRLASPATPVSAADFRDRMGHVLADLEDAQDDLENLVKDMTTFKVSCRRQRALLAAVTKMIDRAYEVDAEMLGDA
jgi:hypothetical protein